MSVRKPASMLFLVNGLQLFLGAGLLLGLWNHMLEYSEMLLDLAVGLILLSGLLSLAGLFIVLRYLENTRRKDRENLENLENLNRRLREQRHDYLNQVQIVYGLLELGEFEEARAYLRPVFKDIMKLGRALKTSEPAVNALLQAKMESAGLQGIDFYLEVATQLNQLPVEAWEFCKILANLIDNAITAAAQREGERWVRLRMEELPSRYRIAVENNGPRIPESQRKLIFGQGYTTKKGEGHGMGLSIVEAALKRAGGTMEVESDEEQTSFTFTLPKAGGESRELSGQGGKRRLCQIKDKK